jgi:hypothetical protein
MTRWVLAKPFAAKNGGEDGIAAVEWLAANSAPFIRIHCALSALWGVMFLVYAVARVVIIYNTSISRALWITEIPGIIAIGICLIASGRPASGWRGSSGSASGSRTGLPRALRASWGGIALAARSCRRTTSPANWRRWASPANPGRNACWRRGW